MARVAMGFGTVPTVRKPKPQAPQVDTKGQQVATLSPTGSVARSGEGGGGGNVATTGGGGFPGRTMTPVIATPPNAGGGNSRPTVTPLGSSPVGAPPKGSTGAATGTPASKPAGPPPGAPDPGTPNTGAIPPIQSDEDAISDANTDYNSAYGSAYQGVQSAASAYGDPTIMGQYGIGSVNPNSALALAAVKALQANQANDATQTNNGTFFSSINQTARGNIDSQQQRDDTAGYQAWQDALARFNTAVSGATTTRDRIIRNAREDEATQAVNHLPTRAAPVPGAGGAGGAGGGAAPGPGGPVPTGKPTAEPRSSHPNPPPAGPRFGINQTWGRRLTPSGGWGKR